MKELIELYRLVTDVNIRAPRIVGKHFYIVAGENFVIGTFTIKNECLMLSSLLHFLQSKRFPCRYHYRFMFKR